MATFPVSLRTAAGVTFTPGPGLPVITDAGASIPDQATLDAVRLAAVKARVRLWAGGSSSGSAAPAFTPAQLAALAGSYVSPKSAQTFTAAEQDQAIANIGAVADLDARRVTLIPVASRGSTYNEGLSNGTDTSGTFTYKHTVVHATGDVRLRYGNFYNNAGIDTVGPNSITVKASVQITDQSGSSVTLPVFFGGKRSVTIEAGAVIDSDPVAIDQAAGATFFSKTFVSVTAGQKWPTGLASSPTLGEGNNRGAPGADLTDSTTMPATVNEFGYGPIAIVGNAPSLRVPVVAGVGDSVLAGNGDSNTLGFFYRALSGLAAEQRIAYPSEQAVAFRQVKYSQRRLPLIRACTHAVCEYGINDIKSAATPANLELWLSNIWQALARRGIRTWQTTLTPVTTSTDAWATTTNQTVTANEANRVAVNTWIRAGAPLDSSSLAPVAVGTSGALVAGAAGHPLVGYLDMADVVETARNSGIWKAGWTSDGTHPLTAGHTAMAALMPPSLFTF